MMWAERQSARRARGVVTHSRAHRERLGNLYGLSRIEFIPHGIPIPPSRAVEPGQPHVLSLGRLTTRKGGKTLLAAIPLILAAHPGTRFTIVGAGDDHPLVRDFQAAHPATGGVQFIEFASGEALEALYSVATVYASASVYESFGLTFVEAQARNIPVVGCATSAMNEIIVDRETGLLVAPSDPQSLADAVVRLLGDPALRERLGREGRRIAVEQYSADRMAGDIDAWYRRVLNR